MKYSEALRLAGRTFPDNLVTCRVISNYQFDTFRTFLRAYGALNQVEYVVSESGYQNFWNDLFRLEEEDSFDFYILVCTLEDILPHFGYRHIGDWNYAELSEMPDLAGDKIDEFVANLFTALSRTKKTVYLVPPFLDPPPLLQPKGSRYDVGSELQVHVHSVMLRESRKLDHIVVLNTAHIFASLSDRDRRNDKLLFSAGSPISAAAASELAKATHELQSPRPERKKMVITDLDNTFWRGIIGEDGITGISALPEGDTYHHHVYQKFLELLQSEGVLLAVCSKNNPGDVEELFENSVLMQEAGVRIGREKFVAVSCSWEPKSEQIRKICEKCNLLPSSVVFVDDNPLEIIDVQQNLPDVTCLQFPESSCIHELIAAMREHFPLTSLTEEDRMRTYMYKLKQETELKSKAYASHTDFLKDLAMRLRCRIVGAEDSQRAFQLINKVNQFNLTGQRFDKNEWLRYIASEEQYVAAGQLIDCLGDHGEIIVGMVRKVDRTLYIDNLVLSCRVFNRGVETAFLQWLVKQFPDIREMIGIYEPTGKNAPVEPFFLKNRFIKVGESGNRIYFRNDELDFKDHYITIL